MYKFNIDSPTGKQLGTLQMWFPKIILQADNVLNLDYLSRLQTFTETIIDKQGVRTDALNVESTHQTDNLINYPEFKILMDEIIERVKAFGESMGFSSMSQMKNLKISNMWANRSAASDFNFPHVHPNSVISGVFYIDAPANCTITFYDNVYNMGPDPKEFTTFSYRHTKYLCTKNSLLLFKSDLLHGNEKQPVGNKIAISFNVVF